MKRYRNADHRRFVRYLRRNMSEAECAMWYRLRARRCLGWKFRRQAPIGPFVADFLCVERRLVVEIEGDTHSTGKDAGRDALPRARGYRTLRFSNRDVLTNLDGVLTALKREMDP